MDQNCTYRSLLDTREKQGCGFVLLLDPDDLSQNNIGRTVSFAANNGVDAFFVGGSLLLGNDFDQVVFEIKKAAGEKPVILFPGSVQQISPHADALLFLSLISGRNPQYLIGNQVLAAPLLWRMNLEAISCGYMLVESAGLTSAQFVSHTLPIPREKPKIALAHALAAQYLGMKSVYLEAGSGARETVPDAMIQLLKENLSIPVIVGGGICSPEEAHRKSVAGADFIVIGNHFQDERHQQSMPEFAEAIHRR